jgi:hypothetical protein
MPLNMPKLASDTDVMDVQPPGLPRPLVDESVVKQVTGLMKQDSPLMTQAKTAGLQQANQRGLLHSSMAVGSAQDSAYRAALPIASQEAAQRAQRNMQSIDIGSREGMQGRDIEATRQNQIRDIEARFGLQANDAASLMQRLEREIASREGMQADEIEFRRQAMMEEIAARFGLQENEVEAQMQRLEADIASRQTMQQREIGYQQTERALDRELQQVLASMNLSSSDRNAASQMLVNMESLYEERYRTIMANTDLDAATRTQQLQSAMNLRNAQIDFIQQMYDIQLNWPQ